jgi:hypothetical protein
MRLALERVQRGLSQGARPLIQSRPSGSQSLFATTARNRPKGFSEHTHLARHSTFQEPSSHASMRLEFDSCRS